MKKSTTLFLLCCLISLQAISQSSPFLCGNDIFSSIVHKNYPALHDAFNGTFESALSEAPQRSQEPLIVNVVVHVVWKEDAENLHDSIIHDQLRVLNDDFNRKNSDTSNLRSLFKSEAGSTDIHFELAGIVRVQTDLLFEIDILGTNLLGEVKHTAEGGSDAWDPDHYVNIWVCKIQPITIFGLEIGQVLGFAFPPNNLDHWPADSGAPSPGEDGVVIDYRVFGSNNPNLIQMPGGGSNLEVNGRTAVHEVGHYFGLRHIWGDGGLLGPNDCAQSDGIDDTPFASAQSAFDCDTSKNSCTQIELHYSSDVPDLIENYMDYASESCMNMFTNGQATLIRNVLTGPRSGLLMPFSSVDSKEIYLDFRIMPNPSGGQFWIELAAEESMMTSIRIIHPNGRVTIERKSELLVQGVNRIAMDGLRLTPGMYFVEIRTEKGTQLQKLIIQ